MRSLIERAILARYPNAQNLTDFELRLTEQGIVISAWRLLDPPPTADEIDTLAAQYDAAEAQAQSEASALRASIVTIASTAVGVRIDQLSATQVRALFACIVWESGGIANNLTVRPLAEWLKQ